MNNIGLSNSIRGVVFECMRSFMMITEFLIQDGQIEAAEKCINAMRKLKNIWKMLILCTVN